MWLNTAINVFYSSNNGAFVAVHLPRRWSGEFDILEKARTGIAGANAAMVILRWPPNLKIQALSHDFSRETHFCLITSRETHVRLSILANRMIMISSSTQNRSRGF